MRYVKNLIDWGDQLFQRDTRETITQAATLYGLADRLLGPRSIEVSTCPTAPAKSYAEIAAAYATAGTAAGGSASTIVLDQKASATDGFYNGLMVEILTGIGQGQRRMIRAYDGASRTATVIYDWNNPAPASGSDYKVSGIPQFYIDLENANPALAAATLSDVPYNDLSLYFCVPENADLMAYWDRIEDRMFKIRHCMNIAGVERALALFAPPIDPNALIRAAASGSLGGGAGALGDPTIPNYRFEVMIEKAKSLTGSVAQLGNALLAALEKKDAEALALLRNSQEAAILKLTTAVKENQIREVQETGRGLQAAWSSAETRNAYYTQLLAEGLSPGEQQSVDAMAAALAFNILAGITKTAASIGYAIPQVGSPFAMTYGGVQVGSMVHAASGVFEIASLVSTYVSQRSLTTSGYDRRATDWELQQTLSGIDMQQTRSQIDANAIRQEIALRDLQIHKAQIADNTATADFLTRKFTNEQLYQWMATRLSNLYFQSYSLAYDMAASAQRAYQYQLGSNERFLSFGYWDSLKKGLTSGEQLLGALEAMEASYLRGNSRPLAIERTLPLSQLDPKALMDLKATGECVFAFTEKLFDDDYPGHYKRQITTLSVSIPAVIGLYQNIKATLTQLSNTTVLQPKSEAVAFLLSGGDAEFGPDVLRQNWWPNQQVALSGGIDANGMFELNFSDQRYLPFENTGAVSNWRFSMPLQTNRIDYDAISDVIVSLRYTAYDGGKRFHDEITRLPALSAYDGAILLPLRQQFPEDWHAFMTIHPDPKAQTMAFAVPPSAVARHVSKVQMTGFVFRLDLAPGVKLPVGAEFITFHATDTKLGAVAITLRADGTAAPVTLASPLHMAAVLKGDRRVVFDLGKAPKAILKDGRLDPEKVVGIGMILDYSGTIEWPK